MEAAVKIVHVIIPKSILPKGMKSHPPFEYHFEETDTDDDVLAQLDEVKRVMGFQRYTTQQGVVAGRSVPVGTAVPDEKSGFAYDHPETIVAVGHEGPGRTFVEDRRLKGPKPTTP